MSLQTATEAMFSFLRVQKTLHAISPLFATRTLRNCRTCSPTINKGIQPIKWMVYAAEAAQEISVEELEYLEAKYKSEKSFASVSSDTKFLYGWGLIRSKYMNDNKKGIALLEELLASDIDKRRDCLFYISIGYFRLHEYGSARQSIIALLNIEPDNAQAKSLLELIESKTKEDATYGLFAIGGAVAVVTGLAAATAIMLFKKTRN